ncbi:hypothetical protein A6A06_30265 [Streptomyces sp. CB02923]|uniref:hypothetical protein n=1 Tax=Streptomyces sp. CB02923 TaxID=1718985 RepID=UPI00093D341F|nr:hypothetical protein [Streptomyces sp. CB02923]OKH98453.1 hypothetical protein A6A06_30265 [Streptomyces sp. CB02923]
MVGTFLTVAVGAAWLNGTLPGGFAEDGWSAYALGHAVAAGGLLIGRHWLRRGRQATRESRTQHQPVLAAHRDAVLAREAESKRGDGPGRE